MLERKGFMPINYLKKESYTGSCHGMRFKMAKAEAEGEKEGETRTVLRVTHWPEPYGFDATPQEKKTSVDMSFDEEGIQAGIRWLNEAFEKQYSNEACADEEDAHETDADETNADEADTGEGEET